VRKTKLTTPHYNSDFVSISSKMYRARRQAVSRMLCDSTRKKMTFMGLESHTFCYPGRFPKPVRLQEISNPRLASEYIITDRDVRDQKSLSPHIFITDAKMHSSRIVNYRKNSSWKLLVNSSFFHVFPWVKNLY